MMNKIIFIGGTGRCGTNIVKDILAIHPDAASLPFEYRFIIDPDGLIDFYNSLTTIWSPYIVDRKLKRLECFLNTLGREPLNHRLLGSLIQWWDPSGKILSPRTYHGWELNHHLPNFGGHVKDLMSKLIELSFRAYWVGTESYHLFPKIYHAAPKPKEELAQILGDFIRNVINDLMKKNGKKFFVEDNTWNIFFAREILELVPDVKIVHVYRDPRDVVASLSQQHWGPTDKVQGARLYKSMMNYWFKIRSSLPIESFYEIKLEDLVSHTEKELTKICSFAGISFKRVMLQTDLSRSHSGRWRQEYSEEEKEKVHSILAYIIKELGY